MVQIWCDLLGPEQVYVSDNNDVEFDPSPILERVARNLKIQEYAEEIPAPVEEKGKKSKKKKEDHPFSICPRCYNRAYEILHRRRKLCNTTWFTLS